MRLITLEHSQEYETFNWDIVGSGTSFNLARWQICGNNITHERAKPHNLLTAALQLDTDPPSTKLVAKLWVTARLKHDSFVDTVGQLFARKFNSKMTDVEIDFAGLPVAAQGRHQQLLCVLILVVCVTNLHGITM